MDAWRTLLQAGLPDGPPRPPPDTAASAADLRDALQRVLAQTLDTTSREVLVAWMSALRSHFPSMFAAIAGPDGEERLRTLRQGVDPDRYLKLRRIAIANLAGIF